MALKKQLGLLEIFSIAAGAMISSGLFILPAVVFGKVGPAIIISYILAGVMYIPTMFTKAELSTAMPKAGGEYFYIMKSMGPIAGVFAGFANWLALSLKSAFALVGIGALFQLLNPSVPYTEVKFIAAGFAFIFMLLNLSSIKGATRLQVILVISLIVILGVYILGGVRFSQVEHYSPFFVSNWRVIFGVTGMIFISYGGVTKIDSVAEEVKNPGKIIPLGMFLAFGIVYILYLSVITLTVGALPSAEFQKTLMPLSLAARSFGGLPAEIILSLAAAFAFITTANAGILSASRVSFAMSRDRLVPEPLGKISKNKIPQISVLFTGIFMIIAILFLRLEELVKVASTMMILLFIMVNIALMIMRHSKITYYKPVFKAPFYPYIQIISVLLYLFLIVEMGTISILLTGGFFLLGLVWYFIFAKRRARSASVFAYIVKKAGAKEIAGKGLEKELMEILREREEIIEDRFDKEIMNAEILDLEGPMDFKEFFKIASQKISKKTEIAEEKIYNEFINREKISSTVIKSGLAIPHIIIPGEKTFFIMPVRCRWGILFENEQEAVNIAFVLAGTIDDRKFHLKTLMAIAQIIQEESFESKWLSAKSKEELRSILLLSRRAREK